MKAATQHRGGVVGRGRDQPCAPRAGAGASRFSEKRLALGSLSGCSGLASQGRLPPASALGLNAAASGDRASERSSLQFRRQRWSRAGGRASASLHPRGRTDAGARGGIPSSVTGRGAGGPCPGRSQSCPGGLTSEVLLRRQVSEDSPQGTETRRHRARPPGRARPGRRHVAAQLLRWGSACPRPVTVTEVLCLLGLGSLRRSCVSTRAASSAPARGRAWPMWGARRSPCSLGEKNPVTEVSVAPLGCQALWPRGREAEGRRQMGSGR